MQSASEDLSGQPFWSIMPTSKGEIEPVTFLLPFIERGRPICSFNRTTEQLTKSDRRKNYDWLTFA